MMGLHLVLSGWIKGKRKRKGRKGSSSQYSLSRISYCDDEEEKEWSGPRNLRPPYPNKDPLFVGSCNGFLCLQYERGFSNERGAKCVVWEPSTDKFQVIPNPPSMQHPCVCELRQGCFRLVTSNYGLGFDDCSKDYKLVTFTENWYQREEVYDSTTHYTTWHVQVYSVKNNSWKELSYPLSKDMYPISINSDDDEMRRGTCVDGVCYWFAHCVNDGHLILSFDFVTHTCSYFHHPDHKLEEDYHKVLMELDGSLCLVFYPMESQEKGPRRNRKKVVEILEEGIINFWVYNSSSSSWSRGIDYDVSVKGFHQPLWLGKKNNKRINGGGYSLLLQGPKGALIEYDYATREFNKIYQETRYSHLYLDVFPYVETETNNNANIWHVPSSSSSST